MTRYNPRFLKIETLAEANQAIDRIGSDPKSIDIMAPKAVLKVIQLENVVLQDAIIIKQDMLSIGGEVALPKEAFALKETTASILIMGTVAQLRELVEKLNRHYTRIKTIAQDLSLLLIQIA